MLLRIVSAITIIGNITRLIDWINYEKIFQVLLILFSWNLKKTLIRQNIPLPSTTPASYCQTSPWRFVSGQKDIFKSFSNQELYLYRFNLYSETGDYNWLFGYSIELNPDKMNMCKYPWLDKDHSPSFGAECSSEFLFLHLKCLPDLNHTSRELVFCLSGSRGFENCFRTPYQAHLIRKRYRESRQI